MRRSILVPCGRCGAVNRVAEVKGKAPVCGKCKSALAFHDGVIDVDANGLEKLIRKSAIPVIVYFWAEWCGPCRFFAPTYASVAGDSFGRAVFAKVDTERSQGASQHYAIRAIPTLVVFRIGKEVQRQEGALSEDALRQLVESL